MKEIPAIRITNLTEPQVRAFMLADNRLAELAQWDESLLAENLKFLSEYNLNFEWDTIGFDYGEIEYRILQFENTGEEEADKADEIPQVGEIQPICRKGDAWYLGDHRLLCSDATVLGTYEKLFENQQAVMIFSDPPYNLAAREIGQVCKSQHGDFAMAAGEMTSEEFTVFLDTVMMMLCRFSVPGSIHFLFMDWRHASEILKAGLKRYDAFKNLCVWVKDRAGMGSFYRSQHELVFVFKNGKDAHQNNFELGQFGRTRSNVWSYPSVRSMNSEDGDPDSEDALNLHPTVKPVKLIEDAILDCSRRGEVVLDPFLGSGSTLIACEKTYRLCYGIELEQRYADVAIQRWQQWTGKEAIHAETGMTYSQLSAQRCNTIEENNNV